MSVCVTGITCLQLYWNFQNYKATVKTFKHDINAALKAAVDKEIDKRHEKTIAIFKKWLADTSFVQITCSVQNRDSSTVFNLKDTHPYPGFNKGLSFGLTYFKEKLHQITPKAKQIYINHLADNMLKGHLRAGIIYYYTQRLGDSLSKIHDESRVDTSAFKQFFKQELLSRSIDVPFTLNPSGRASKNSFVTLKFNASLRRPLFKEMVFAGFESPNTYFLREMRWLLVSSFLLISITIFCFAYTVKTLLSQQKLSELKNDFVNNMTHELKTPVATINIAAEAIQDFNLSKASADEYLGIIRYQAGNLTHLIDQILKNVVSEQENAGLNLSKVNTGELIDKIIEEYKPQSAAANICVKHINNAGYLIAMADVALLKNAIANLLDNAIKYSGNGAVVNITQSAENGSIIIKVSDNGPGIPQQYQDKVFSRFFRVPSGDIHNVKGYGLGLNYAKSIIERHKGSLKLTSKEGHGAEFIISIPHIYHEIGQSSVA